jgi:hypothetical protein
MTVDPSRTMHRLQYLKPFPKKVRFPLWIFFGLLSVTVGMAAYYVIRRAIGIGCITGPFAGALLWNIRHAINHGEIPVGQGMRPPYRRETDPFGFWCHLIFFITLYVVCLIAPPLFASAEQPRPLD